MQISGRSQKSQTTPVYTGNYYDDIACVCIYIECIFENKYHLARDFL